VGKKPTDPNTTDVFFTFKVTCRFSNLWVAPYTPYQQFLYDSICEFREKGWNYQEIADWLNENNYRTPRNKKFLGAHAYSIVKKKRIREKRLTTMYQPVLSDFAQRFVDRTLIN
jgi:hypothetical protein